MQLWFVVSLFLWWWVFFVQAGVPASKGKFLTLTLSAMEGRHRREHVVEVSEVNVEVVGDPVARNEVDDDCPPCA